MNRHYLNSEFNIKNFFKKTFRKKISLLLVISIVFLNLSALIVHAQMQSDEFIFGFNNDTTDDYSVTNRSRRSALRRTVTTANDMPMSETASSAPATSTPAPSSATASSAPATSTPSVPISVTASSTPTTGSDDQVKRQIEELQKEIDKLKQELETSKNTRNNDQSGQSGQSGQNSSNGNSMMEDLMKMMMLGQLMQMLSGLQGGGGGGFGGGDGGDFGGSGDEFGGGAGTQNLSENGDWEEDGEKTPDLRYMSPQEMEEMCKEERRKLEYQRDLPRTKSLFDTMDSWSRVGQKYTMTIPNGAQLQYSTDLLGRNTQTSPHLSGQTVFIPGSEIDYGMSSYKLVIHTNEGAKLYMNEEQLNNAISNGAKVTIHGSGKTLDEFDKERFDRKAQRVEEFCKKVEEFKTGK